MNNESLFWISFVGIILFIISSIYNSFVLRLQKIKEFPQSEFLLQTFFTVLSVIFIVLSLNMNINYKKYSKTTPPQSNELHLKVGEFIMYDPITNKSDTLEIFKLSN